VPLPPIRASHEGAVLDPPDPAPTVIYLIQLHSSAGGDEGTVRTESHRVAGKPRSDFHCWEPKTACECGKGQAGGAARQVEKVDIPEKRTDHQLVAIARERHTMRWIAVSLRWRHHDVSDNRSRAAIEHQDVVAADGSDEASVV